MFCRSTVYWELSVNWKDDCEYSWKCVEPAPQPPEFFGIAVPYPSVCFVYTPFPFHPRLVQIWKFWFRNISTTFLPFFTLCVCNAVIVSALRRQTRREEKLKMGTQCLSQAVGT
jgi:hypothetical protein